MKLKLKDLDISLDKENCPVEGMTLVETQPVRSLELGVFSSQFDKDLNLIEVKDQSITIDPREINQRTSNTILALVSVKTATLVSPKTVLLTIDTSLVNGANFKQAI